MTLSDKGGGSGGLVLEGRRELLLLDVVASKTVDTRLDENHAAERSAMYEGVRKERVGKRELEIERSNWRSWTQLNAQAPSHLLDSHA